jgi:hypothetical protein
MTWSKNSSGKWVFVNDGIGYANDPTHANVPNPNKLPDPPAPNATPTPGSKVNPTNKEPNSNLDPLPKGVQLDWSKFLDGSFVLQSGGTEGSIAGQPYVSGAPLADGRPNPKSIIILPSDDGKGYLAQDLDAAVEEYINRIPNIARESYKQKLKDYYPDKKSYAVSIAGGPVIDNDLGFQAAVKKALQATSVDNFKSGVTIANQKQTNPNYDPSGALYSFQTFVNTRSPLPDPTSTSSRTSQLTTKEDALREFYRTVQDYVGDPLLVNELDKLANQYWLDLSAEESKRVSTGFSTTNAFGQTTSTSRSFAQLTDLDRLEMRIKLITRGSTKAKSTGIKEVEPTKLQEAGGEIGNYYTELLGHSYKTGIRISNEALLSKVEEINRPGGSIDEQKRSLTQASKLKYKALAPYIDAGISVGDFIADFSAIKARELDLNPKEINVFDDDIQKAITGDTLLGPEDFTNLVRKNPNWRYGSTANNLAAQFINSISTTFGKIG